jgi:hypothetical protein
MEDVGLPFMQHFDMMWSLSRPQSMNFWFGNEFKDMSVELKFWFIA